MASPASSEQTTYGRRDAVSERRQVLSPFRHRNLEVAFASDRKRALRNLDDALHVDLEVPRALRGVLLPLLDSFQILRPQPPQPFDLARHPDLEGRPLA